MHEPAAVQAESLGAAGEKRLGHIDSQVGVE
jgi:hypothetical protein